MKLTYKESKNKKQVRDFLFSLFIDQQLNKVVGLAGPDINDYISFCKSRGYDEFEIYENNLPTAINQIRLLRTKSNLSITYGNILNADASRQNVLFDLDYCVTVRFMRDHIRKFKNNFIMTFARRIDDNETFNLFLEARKENIKSVTTLFSPIKHSILSTEEGNEYYYVEYRDTSNMCCFAKIN